MRDLSKTKPQKKKRYFSFWDTAPRADLKPRPKICTARVAGGTDFGILYLIVLSYLCVKTWVILYLFSSTR